jgi:hypothetical protein
METESQKCQTKLAYGKICNRDCVTGSSTCKTHTIIAKHAKKPKRETPKGTDVKPKNSTDEVECAICFEKDVGENMHKLTCEHYFHMDCLRGLTSMVCPMCRAPLLNIPDDVKENIEKNSAKWEKEKVTDEIAEIRRMIHDQMRPLPQVEVTLAFTYLKKNGIPDKYIPITARLQLNPESPLPPIGAIFNQTVMTVINNIQAEIEMDEIDTFIPSDDEDEVSLDSTEENVFEENKDDEHAVIRVVQTRPTADSQPGVVREVAALFNNITFSLADLVKKD